MKKTSCPLLLKTTLSLGLGLTVCGGLNAFNSQHQQHQSAEQNFEQKATPIVIPPNKFSAHIDGLVISWRQEEKTNLVLNFAGSIVAEAYKRQSTAGKSEWSTELLMPAMPKEYREWEEVLDKISKISEQSAQSASSTQQWESKGDKDSGSSITSTANLGDMTVTKNATFHFDFSGSAHQDSEVYSGIQSLSLNPHELNNPAYWQGQAIFPVVFNFVLEKLAAYENEDIDWGLIEQQGLELAQNTISSQCGKTTHVKK